MLKAAIFGVGTWGARLVHSVQGSEKFRFVKAISRDPGRHRELAEQTGIKFVSSFGRVLKDPEIDAVVLATPHSLHHKQIMQAAKAGKHVYVEKPLALKRKHAQQAVDACRAAGVTLGLGFTRRYAPPFLEMMKRIKAGDIGDVLHVEGQHAGPTGYRLKAGNWRGTRAESPGGGMSARGIHALDAMISIAGPVASVYAFSDKRKLPPEIEIDDTTSMLLRFANGATGYLGTVFVTGDFYRVHVFGSKGWLELRGDTELITHGLEGAAERLPMSPTDKERATLEGFADAVAARQPFVVPPDEIVNGIAVLEAIVASAAKGRPVPIK